MSGIPVSVHDGISDPRASLLASVQGATALIALTSDRIDEEVFEAAGGSLKVVANYAVGFDNVDTEAAARHGVVVTNTPDVLDAATADLAFALLLALSRRVVEADRFVRSGADWKWKPDFFVGLDVSAGATLGIVGLGRIGMAMARRARAFGMRVIATGSRAVSDSASDMGIQPSTFEELVEQSDVISIHCPLDAKTWHLFGPEQFGAMKESALLINTSRGAVVDELALVDALRGSEIGGAALDVFEFEPRVTRGLLELANVITVPHIGSAADETRKNMAALAVRNVLAVLGGEDAITPV